MVVWKFRIHQWDMIRKIVGVKTFLRYKKNSRWIMFMIIG